MQIIKKVISGGTPDLFEAYRDLGLGATFSVDTPAWVIVTGHIDCEHRAKAGTIADAIMVAFNAQLNGSWIEGAKTGLNIYDRTDHYGLVPISFSVRVPAGTHTITLFGRSASTAAVGVDGLAEIKDGFNCITYQIIEDEPV